MPIAASGTSDGGHGGFDAVRGELFHLALSDLLDLRFGDGRMLGHRDLGSANP